MKEKLLLKAQKKKYERKIISKTQKKKQKNKNVHDSWYLLFTNCCVLLLANKEKKWNLIIYQFY